jgi:outer membrane protein
MGRVTRALLFACAAFSLSANAVADTVFGVYAGAGSWFQDYEGDARSGIDTLDLVDDLGFGRQSNTYFYVALEHPVPFLPNVMLQRTSLSQSADNLLTRSIVFNGQAFSFSTDVNTEIDMEQTDAVLYYELLDNALSVDVGLAARYVDGFVSIRELATTTTAEFKGVLPMLFARARVDLPFSGAWLGVRAQGLTYDGNSLIDADAQIGWASKFGVGFEVGYRMMKFDIEQFDDVDEASIEVKGPYAALNYHF